MPRLATLPRQLFWFMLVGALSTVLQTVVYVAVRLVVPATWASWIALLAITPLNTEAHRRVTFHVTTSAVGRLHWEAGLTSVAVYLANLVAAPWFTGIAGPHPTSLEEALILALTGSLIGGLRYLLLRGWVFAQHRHQPAAPAMSSAEPFADVTAPARRQHGSERPGLSPASVAAQGEHATEARGTTRAIRPTGANGLTRASRTGGINPPDAGEPTGAGIPARASDATNASGPTSGTSGRCGGFGFRLIRRPGRRCLSAAGSRLRRVRRSPADRRSSAPDQRPASTR